MGNIGSKRRKVINRNKRYPGYQNLIGGFFKAKGPI